MSKEYLNAYIPTIRLISSKIPYTVHPIKFGHVSPKPMAVPK